MLHFCHKLIVPNDFRCQNPYRTVWNTIFIWIILHFLVVGCFEYIYMYNYSFLCNLCKNLCQKCFWVIFFCRFSSEFSVFISVLIKHYQILYSERAINTFAINKEIKSYKNFEVFGSSLCSNSKKWNYCVLTTPW